MTGAASSSGGTRPWCPAGTPRSSDSSRSSSTPSTARTTRRPLGGNRDAPGKWLNVTKTVGSYGRVAPRSGYVVQGYSTPSVRGPLGGFVQPRFCQRVRVDMPGGLEKMTGPGEDPRFDDPALEKMPLRSGPLVAGLGGAAESFRYPQSCPKGPRPRSAEFTPLKIPKAEVLKIHRRRWARLERQLGALELPFERERLGLEYLEDYHEGGHLGDPGDEDFRPCAPDGWDP